MAVINIKYYSVVPSSSYGAQGGSKPSRDPSVPALGSVKFENKPMFIPNVRYFQKMMHTCMPWAPFLPSASVHVHHASFSLYPRTVSSVICSWWKGVGGLTLYCNYDAACIVCK